MAKERKNFKKNNKKVSNEIKYCYPRNTEDLGNKKGFIEYKMPVAMIKDLLYNDKKAKSDPQRFLCDYVNDQYNLMGYCVRVIPF